MNIREVLKVFTHGQKRKKKHSKVVHLHNNSYIFLLKFKNAFKHVKFLITQRRDIYIFFLHKYQLHRKIITLSF